MEDLRYTVSPEVIAAMARRQYQDPPLRVAGARRKRWEIRVRRNVLIGKGQVGRRQERVFLGWCDEVGEKEAKRLRADKLREVNGQVYALQSHIPFREFLRTYEEQHVCNLGWATRRRYLSQMQGHLVPAFGELRLCDVDAEAVQRFLNDRSHLSYCTRKDLRNLISSVYRKADDWGYWQGRNPAERGELGRPRPAREKRLLTDMEARRLLAALPPILKLLARLIRFTGLRISEAMGLRWGDIDFAAGWLAVRRRYYCGDVDEPKSELARRGRPLGDLAADLRAILPAGAGPEAYVFADPNGVPQDHRHTLREVARDLGLWWPGFGWHSFRREFLTKMQEAGASSIEAQLAAGHSRVSMTGEYTVLQRARQESLVREMQRQMEGTVN